MMKVLRCQSVQGQAAYLPAPPDPLTDSGSTLMFINPKVDERRAPAATMCMKSFQSLHGQEFMFYIMARRDGLVMIDS